MKQLILITTLISTACFSQSWQWGKRGGSADNLNQNAGRAEEVYSIVTDSDRNIYALSTVGTMALNFDGVSDLGYSDPNSISETALVSFTCDGTFRWSKIIGGRGFETFLNLQIDANDNIYLAGNFGGASLYPYAQHIDDDFVFPTMPIDNRKMIIIKYSKDGELVWYNKPQHEGITIPETNSTYPYRLEIGSDGILYWLVRAGAGSFENGTFTISENGWYVWKYDLDGNFLGAIDLELTSPAPFYRANFLRDPVNGNFLIAARTISMSQPGWAVVGSEQINNSFFIASFASDGSALWKRENSTTTAGTLILHDLKVDAAHQIFLSGVLVGGMDSFLGASIPEFQIPSFVMKLDEMASEIQWWSYHNKGSMGYGALALKGNEVAVTTWCAGTNFTWGNQTFSPSNTNEGTEVLFARFNTDSGECTSLTKIPGSIGNNDYGCAIAVDAAGDYLVGGNFSGTLYFDGGASITNIGGQSDFFIAKYAAAACAPLATNEFEQQKINAFPNPVRDLLTVSVQEPMDFAVYDMLGKIHVVGKISIDQNTINVQSLAPGLYLLKLQRDHSAQTIKVIKE